MNGPTAQIPTPPVYAARLSQLLKTFANAESHLSTAVKSREELISALEKLLDTNRTALSQETRDLESINQRQGETEQKKKDVEDAIMKGLNYDPTGDNSSKPGADATNEPEQPTIEALTPPVESLTPVGSPTPPRESAYPEQPEQNQQLPPLPPPQAGEQALPTHFQSQAGSNAPAQTTIPNLPDLLHALAAKSSVPAASQTSEQPSASTEATLSASQQPPIAGTGTKRRRLAGDGGDEFIRYPQNDGHDATTMTLDSEVDELLKQEGGQYQY